MAERAEFVEASWIYVSGAMQVADRAEAAATYDRLANVCVESGWHVYRPYADKEHATARRHRHALAHADACVFYVGRPSSGVGAELAWATEHGRPVLAVFAENECPSALLMDMLNEYDRVRLVHGRDADDCVRLVHETLRDPAWGELLRSAAGDLAQDAPA